MDAIPEHSTSRYETWGTTRCSSRAGFSSSWRKIFPRRCDERRSTLANRREQPVNVGLIDVEMRRHTHAAAARAHDEAALIELEHQRLDVAGFEHNDSGAFRLAPGAQNLGTERA